MFYNFALEIRQTALLIVLLLKDIETFGIKAVLDFLSFFVFSVKYNIRFLRMCC